MIVIDVGGRITIGIERHRYGSPLHRMRVPVRGHGVYSGISLRMSRVIGRLRRGTAVAFSWGILARLAVFPTDNPPHTRDGAALLLRPRHTTQIAS